MKSAFVLMLLTLSAFAQQAPVTATAACGPAKASFDVKLESAFLVSIRDYDARSPGQRHPPSPARPSEMNDLRQFFGHVNDHPSGKQGERT